MFIFHVGSAIFIEDILPAMSVQIGNLSQS